MDEVGNRNLTFDRVAARIGHEQAKRYVIRDEQPRGTTQQTDAALENVLIQMGQQVPVLPAQLHGTHLEVHFPMAAQWIDGVVGGQIDPTQAIGTIEALAVHLNQHAEAISGDPTQENLVAQALDLSNKLGQIAENTQRSIEADQGQGGGGEPSPEQSKAMEMQAISQVKQEIMRAESATKQEIKMQEAQQEQRLKDFKAAQEVLRENDTTLAPPV